MRKQKRRRKASTRGERAGGEGEGRSRSFLSGADSGGSPALERRRLGNPSSGTNGAGEEGRVQERRDAWGAYRFGNEEKLEKLLGTSFSLREENGLHGGRKLCTN
jgi:hypothetical protein